MAVRRAASEQEGEAEVRQWEKARLLRALDDLWLQYLRDLSNLHAAANIRRALRAIDMTPASIVGCGSLTAWCALERTSLRTLLISSRPTRRSGTL